MPLKMIGNHLKLICQALLIEAKMREI